MDAEQSAYFAWADGWRRHRAAIRIQVAMLAWWHRLSQQAMADTHTPPHVPSYRPPTPLLLEGGGMRYVWEAWSRV